MNEHLLAKRKSVYICTAFDGKCSSEQRPLTNKCPYYTLPSPIACFSFSTKQTNTNKKVPPFGRNFFA